MHTKELVIVANPNGGFTITAQSLGGAIIHSVRTVGDRFPLATVKRVASRGDYRVIVRAVAQ